MALFKNVFGRFAGTPARAAESASAPSPETLSATALRERGNAALAAGDLSQARELYARAVAADPQDASSRVNLGFVLLESGDPAGARDQLQAALAVRRSDQAILHDVHFLLGRSLRALGDGAGALASFDAALEALPSFTPAMEEAVAVLQEAGEHERALERARRLHASQPSAQSTLLVAQQLHVLGRNDEALGLLDATAKGEPGNAGAWSGLGNVLSALGRHDEAVIAFERVSALAGPAPDVLSNCAGALARAGRFDEALTRAESALRIDPRHPEALRNRLNILLQQVRLQEAIAAGEGALAAYPDDPDLHWNLSVANLLAGRFEAGWREHEWRWKASASRAELPAAITGTRWTGGQDLQGRSILLFAEQGIGDALQMLRYVPWVGARAAKVALRLPVSLHRLVQRELPPHVTFVVPGEPLPACDFHCALMSLPLAFGANEATIPRDVPYLRPDPQLVGMWRRRLERAGQRLKVGIVWFGNASHANDANRSIALAQMATLRADGCFFVSLQQHVRASDSTALEEWTDLHRWGEELVDFDDTAALVEALDLVVSVDTSVAHLAGALGRPVHILLPHCPDWRWMVGRDDSPWYPTARLFRQPRRGDWDAALSEVRTTLRDLYADSGAATLPFVAAPSPSWAELLQLAQEQYARGEATAVLATLDAAQTERGSHPLTDHVRGNALFSLGRYREAAESFDAALDRTPDFQPAAANAAAAWFRCGDMTRALVRAERAARLKPDDAASLLMLANSLQLLGRHPEAIAAARAAHEKFPEDPELEWTYGAVALAAGECEQGWKAIEARWRLPGAGEAPDAKALGCPVWTGGEPVEGRTMLLVGEQGFGDVFQFVRHALELRRRGARVVLLVREPVQELLRQSMPDCMVVTRAADAPRADFHIALMSLPGALGTSLATIPAQVPYLRADSARVENWRARLSNGRGPRVGIVWSGNPAQVNDRNRSMSFEQVIRIATPGVELVNLQRDVRPSDRDALRASGIRDPSGELHSFSDTAALIESLDLVVSVCTGVAHLAGAMGKPVWVLLAHRPDWRWLLGRDDSPWYPTARLFRQPVPGAWEEPLERVRDALAQLAATGRASA
jgi:tetratricopeptide (TPR) repeat protein